MGRPILSPGKKLTGGKFRPVTPGHCPIISKYGPSLSKAVDPSFLFVKKLHFNKNIHLTVSLQNSQNRKNHECSDTVQE